MNAEIIGMLRRVGIPANIKGYEYLKMALNLCWKDKGYIKAVTKRLYPAIAEKFDTTASRVERAIRHAIEVAWDRGDVEVLNHIFGYTIKSDRGKPSNSEFIATLAEQLRIEVGEIMTVGPSERK